MVDTVRLDNEQFNKLLEQLRRIVTTGGQTAQNASGSRSTTERAAIQQAQQNTAATVENTSAVASSTETLRSQTRTIREEERTRREGARLTTSHFGILNNAIRSQSVTINGADNALRQFEGNIIRNSGSIREQSSLLAGMLTSSRASGAALERHTANVLNAAVSIEGLSNHSNGVINSLYDLDAAQRSLARDTEFLNQAMINANGDLSGFIQELNALGRENQSAAQREFITIAQRNNLLGANNAEIQRFITSTREGINGLNNTTQASLRATNALSSLTTTINERLNPVVTAFRHPLVGATAALGLLLSAAKDLAKEYVVMNGMGRGSAEEVATIKKDQILTATSFAEMTDIYRSQTRLLQSVGLDDFSAAIRNNQHTMMDYTLDVSEAIKAQQSYTQNLINSGIDVRNVDKLNKSLKQQNDSYGRLRALTGVTREQFNALNSELYDNHSIQSEMNSLNAADREARMLQYEKLRETFSRLQMSAEDAQKSLLAMKEFGKQKIQSKVEQVAKVRQAASQVGFGGVEELSRMMLKRNMSAEETKYALAKATEILNAADKLQNKNDFGSQVKYAALDEGFEFLRTFVANNTTKAQLARDALGTVSEKQVDNKAKEDKNSQFLITGSQIVSGINAALHDPVAKLLGSILTTLMSIGGGVAAIALGRTALGALGRGASLPGSPPNSGVRGGRATPRPSPAEALGPNLSRQMGHTTPTTPGSPRIAATGAPTINGSPLQTMSTGRSMLNRVGGIVGRGAGYAGLAYGAYDGLKDINKTLGINASEKTDAGQAALAATSGMVKNIGLQMAGILDSVAGADTFRFEETFNNNMASWTKKANEIITTNDPKQNKKDSEHLEKQTTFLEKISSYLEKIEGHHEAGNMINEAQKKVLETLTDTQKNAVAEMLKNSTGLKNGFDPSNPNPALQFFSKS